MVLGNRHYYIPILLVIPKKIYPKKCEIVCSKKHYEPYDKGMIEKEFNNLTSHFVLYDNKSATTEARTYF